jgi:hypothetical protein
MIQYIVDTENKTIELLSGGKIEEIKDLYNLYKDYKFTIATSSSKTKKQGVTVGAGYVPIIGNIEHF